MQILAPDWHLKLVALEIQKVVFPQWMQSSATFTHIGNMFVAKAFPALTGDEKISRSV